MVNSLIATIDPLYFPLKTVPKLPFANFSSFFKSEYFITNFEESMLMFAFEKSDSSDSLLLPPIPTFSLFLFLAIRMEMMMMIMIKTNKIKRIIRMAAKETPIANPSVEEEDACFWDEEK